MVMPLFQLIRTQNIPATVDRVWDFISNPRSLKDITPSFMGFDIVSRDLPERMYPGMIIHYKVRPFLNIKMNWVTEITHIEEKSFFVDEQRLGPYRMWHHEHQIKPVPGGVLMIDLVTYVPPFGFIGAWANSLFIRKRLQTIFDFRRQTIEKTFGKMEEKA
jgi:ligand-binding SRPBCC domain-containing protein